MARTVFHISVLTAHLLLCFSFFSVLQLIFLLRVLHQANHLSAFQRTFDVRIEARRTGRPKNRRHFVLRPITLDLRLNLDFCFNRRWCNRTLLRFLSWMTDRAVNNGQPSNIVVPRTPSNAIIQRKHVADFFLLAGSRFDAGCSSLTFAETPMSECPDYRQNR